MMCKKYIRRIMYNYMHTFHSLLLVLKYMFLAC